MTDPFGGRTEISAEEYRRWLAEQGAGPSTPSPVPAPDWRTSEKAFQQRVSDVARDHGWLGYHTWTSAHSAPGFPDLVLVRGHRLEVAELKVGSNKPTKAQLRWLDAFGALGSDTVGAHLWYPDDWDEIERVLR